VTVGPHSSPPFVARTCPGAVVMGLTEQDAAGEARSTPRPPEKADTAVITGTQAGAAGRG